MLLGTVCRLWFTETFRSALRPLGTVARHCSSWVPVGCWRNQSDEAV